MKRIVCWFSCGNASAAATKLVLDSNDERKTDCEIIIARNYIAEEHPDNERFAKDCEQWFGQPIISVTNDKYEGSVLRVQDDVKFIKGQNGAPCTRLLKKDMRKAFQKPGDIHVFGLHLGEEDRVNKLIDREPDINVWLPLIERNMTKLDCHHMVANAGIEIPMMYRLGYNNNNCIGCVKGGMGYWNKVKRDFPEAFDRMAKQERKIGHAINKKEKPGTREGIPLYLDQLLPTDGRKYEDEPPIKCGIICEAALQPAASEVGP